MDITALIKAYIWLTKKSLKWTVIVGIAGGVFISVFFPVLPPELQRLIIALIEKHFNF